MIFNQKFIPYLLGCLKNLDYVLFEHFAIHQTQPEIPFNFLLAKKSHQRVFDALQAFSGIGVLNVEEREMHTILHITFKDGIKVQLYFWNQLSIDGVEYLNLSEVLSKKQRSKSEFYMPNLEHLFEFSILSHYLSNRGLSIKYQAYFEDFHFFVKDGLIDFFNEKYGTSFANLDDLTTFKDEIKAKIIEYLKKSHSTHFFSKINKQVMSWVGMNSSTRN